MLYSGKMQSITKIHIQYGRNMHLLTLNFSIINITDEPYRVRVRVRVLFWVTSKPKNSSSLSRSQRSLTKYIGIIYKITEQVKYQQMSKTDI